MTEFNFDPRVIDPETYDMERAIVMRGVSLEVARLRRKREAATLPPPARPASGPGCRAGGAGREDLSGSGAVAGRSVSRRAPTSGELPPEGASAERLIYRWKTEPALHTEFGSFLRFASYERAHAAGRAHIFHPQQNRRQSPRRTDRRWTGN